MFSTILATLLSFLGGGVGLLGGAFGLVPKTLAPLVQWIANKQQLLSSLGEKKEMDLHYSNDGEVAEGDAKSAASRLNATSAIFKYGTFFLWFYPFIIGQIRPLYAHVVFDNLAAMPAWYTQSCVVIMFAIWGVSVSAPVISSVYDKVGDTLGQFLQGRRDHHERLAAINRGAVFDSLRDHVKGKMSQEFINVVNKALDAGSPADDSQQQ